MSGNDTKEYKDFKYEKLLDLYKDILKKTTEIGEYRVPCSADGSVIEFGAEGYNAKSFETYLNMHNDIFSWNYEYTQDKTICSIAFHINFVEAINSAHDNKLKEIMARNDEKEKEIVASYENKLKELEQKMKQEKESIFGFNPEDIKKIISNTQTQLSGMKNNALSNTILNPLVPYIEKMEDYLSQIEHVNTIYNDVYTNIIKPIKVESQSGIKATTKWAIIGIAISTLVSVLVSIINLLI